MKYQVVQAAGIVLYSLHVSDTVPIDKQVTQIVHGLSIRYRYVFGLFAQAGICLANIVQSTLYEENPGIVSDIQALIQPVFLNFLTFLQGLMGA